MLTLRILFAKDEAEVRPVTATERYREAARAPSKETPIF